MRFILVLFLFACADLEEQDAWVQEKKASQVMCPVPELAQKSPSSLLLTPQSYTTWPDPLPAVDDILLAPGDYTSWGPLTVRGVGGSTFRRGTVRGVGSGEARIHSFVVAEHSARWVISRLVVEQAGLVEHRTTNVVLHSLVTDDILLTGFTDVCVTATVIRNGLP